MLMGQSKEMGLFLWTSLYAINSKKTKKLNLFQTKNTFYLIWKQANLELSEVCGGNKIMLSGFW